MTPKEKAEELFYKMYNEIPDHYDDVNQAKRLALIAVDEIINCDSFFKTLDDTKYFNKYWQEVQTEINLL